MALQSLGVLGTSSQWGAQKTFIFFCGLVKISAGPKKNTIVHWPLVLWQLHGVEFLLITHSHRSIGLKYINLLRYSSGCLATLFGCTEKFNPLLMMPFISPCVPIFWRLQLVGSYFITLFCDRFESLHLMTICEASTQCMVWHLRFPILEHGESMNTSTRCFGCAKTAVGPTTSPFHGLYFSYQHIWSLWILYWQHFCLGEWLSSVHTTLRSWCGSPATPCGLSGRYSCHWMTMDWARFICFKCQLHPKKIWGRLDIWASNCCCWMTIVDWRTLYTNRCIQSGIGRPGRYFRPISPSFCCTLFGSHWPGMVDWIALLRRKRKKTRRSGNSNPIPSQMTKRKTNTNPRI